MTMTDTILFVKETRTCEYVLVIHTPRLCGEPGFKSRLEQMPEATIRCREVVDNVETVDPSLPEAPYPYKRKSRQPVPSPQRPTEESKDTAATAKDTIDRTHDTARLLRKALESLLRQGGIEDVAMFEVQQGEQEGEFIFDISTEGQELEDTETEQTEGGEPVAKGRGATLEEALRAVGYNIKGRVVKDAAKDDDQKKDNKEPRDEL